MQGDHESYVALKAMFGHQELKVVDLGNKNRRLCEGIRATLTDHTVGEYVRDRLKEVLEENEFIPRP
jgi:hypothetical protein